MIVRENVVKIRFLLGVRNNMHDWICLKIYDKNGERLNLNDQVEFIANKNKHSGFIQGIYNGYIKINSLAGEFRRNPYNVVKL